MCLDSPLKYLFDVPLSHWLHKKKYRFFLGSHFFTISSSSPSIQSRTSFDDDRPVGSTYTKQIISATSDHPRFPLLPSVQPFFSTTPPTSSTTPSLALQLWSLCQPNIETSHQIRHLHYLATYSLPIGPSPIDSTIWKPFWKLPISPAARNAWYRLLHNKWPSRAYLHAVIPSQHPSPICPHCPSSFQGLFHLVLSCKEAHHTWIAIWAHFFPSTPFSASTSWLTIRFLRPPPPNTNIPRALWYSIHGYTLYGIWLSYWHNVFESAPFLATTIVPSILKNVPSYLAPVDSTDTLLS